MNLTPLRRSWPFGLSYLILIEIAINSISPVFTIQSSFNPKGSSNMPSQLTSRFARPEFPEYPNIQYHIPYTGLQTEKSVTGFIPDQNWFSISSKQEHVDMEPSHPKAKEPMKRRRIPGFPKDPPLPSINITNVITLIDMAANETELNDETEALLVQTLKEILTFIGTQDMGDLMGMFLMYFVMGPILIPMLWMPIAIVVLGFLTIPIIYNRPLGRKQHSYYRNSRWRDNLQSSQCLEMLSCEANNFLRSSRWSSWISRTFNLTKVEWAGASGMSKKKGRRSGAKATYFEQDDCTKYSCTLVRPVQRFFGSWYSYIFTYKNTLDNI